MQSLHMEHTTEVGSNKDVKTDAVKLGINAAYGSYVS